MSSNDKRTLTLTNGAFFGLKMILNDSSWHKGDSEALVHSFRASTLLDSVLPEVKPFKPVTETRNGEKAVKDGETDRAVAWENEPVAPFEVTERQFETIKKAIKWAAENGVLPNGKHKLILIQQAGLTPKDE